MFSNTANNSANDSVNTRPRLNAYLNFIKTNEQKIALVLGYILTAALFFGLGYTSKDSNPPQISIEEPAIDLTKLNDNLNAAGTQSAVPETAVAGSSTDDPNCVRKIKGNISSKSKIYHMPGGAFYARTVPEMCFSTEAEAVAAGFRKSQR